MGWAVSTAQHLPSKGESKSQHARKPPSLPEKGWARTSHFKHGPNKGLIVRKVHFHQVPSCCLLSVSLIYGLFAVKAFCTRSLVTREGFCDRLTTVLALPQRLWSADRGATFKQAPEPCCSLVIWQREYPECVLLWTPNTLSFVCFAREVLQRSSLAVAGTS